MASADIEPQILDEDGKPQRRMFRDASSVFTFAHRLETEDRTKKGIHRRRILAMKNGMPPWKEGSKPADQININFGEGEEVLDNRRLPYIERLNQERIPIRCVPREKDPQLRDDIGRVISKEASYAMRLWRGHHRQLSSCVSDMGDFGYGVLMWPNDSDPRFKRVAPWNVFFEADAEPDVDELEIIVIKSRWKVRDLWTYHQAATPNNKMGWKRENIQRVLEHLASTPNSQEPERTKWEELELKLRENSMGETIPGGAVDVYQVAYRDADTQAITLVVVAQIISSEKKQKEGQDGGLALYLREKPKAFDKMRNFVAILPLSSSEETIHSTRGHGHKVLPKAMIASRTKCRALDDYVWNTTTWFNEGSTDSAMRAQIIPRGAYGFIPGALDLVEFPKRSHQADHLGILGMTEQELKRGVTGGAPSVYGRSLNRPSATRERIEQLEENALTSAEVGTFDFYYDNILDEFYRRLTLKADSEKIPGGDLRKIFRDRMEFHEIPEEVWDYDNMLEITAARAIGPGSRFVQQEAATALLSVASAMGPRGAHEALEFFVSAHAGAAQVRRFVPPFENLGQKTDHNWQANQESLAMMQGVAPLPPLAVRRTRCICVSISRTWRRRCRRSRRPATRCPSSSSPRCPQLSICSSRTWTVTSPECRTTSSASATSKN